MLPVLITGESGVGKRALARVLHEASERKDARFVQLNCVASWGTPLTAEENYEAQEDSSTPALGASWHHLSAPC